MLDSTLSTNIILMQRSIKRNLPNYPKLQAIVSNPEGFMRVLNHLDETQLNKSRIFFDEFKKEMSGDLLDTKDIPDKVGKLERWIGTVIKDANSNMDKSPTIYA